MVMKKSGKLEPFQKEKIVRACKGAGATAKVAEKIADEIAKTAHDKITTSEIRTAVLSKLKKKNPAWETAYLEHERTKKKKEIGLAACKIK
jgi:transcriptional regulator NrdR family protein